MPDRTHCSSAESTAGPKLQITYDTIQNAPPAVSAGPDWYLTLGSLATLSGTVSDDGLPTPPGTISVNWTKVSGPGTATFGIASSKSTTAGFSTAGTYVLRLTASDGALSASDDLTCNVAQIQNAAPVVSAGPDRTITLGSTASLAGAVTDDGLPNPPGVVTRNWAKVSGPGTVTFANPSAASTTASFSAAGSYVLRLTASDGAASASDDMTVTVSSSVTQGSGIWISREQLMALPTSGTAWSAMVSAANISVGNPSLANPDDQSDTITLAKALVGVRTGNQALIDQARLAIMAAMGTESGGESIGIARNLNAFVIAADLVGLSSSQDAAFRSWLVTATRQKVYSDGRTMVQMHEERPNNWGLMAGASRATVARYLGNTADLARVAQVFKGWLGDRSSYAGFKYGDLSWQIDSSRPVGILPKGAVRNGRSMDGVLPEEMRRGSSYSSGVWPPVWTGYCWEALQGAFVMAEVLYRAGYDSYNWQDRGLLRAVQFLRGLATQYDASWWATGDDQWQLFIINKRYGTSYATSPSAGQGKIMAWTAWTHQ